MQPQHIGFLFRYVIIAFLIKNVMCIYLHTFLAAVIEDTQVLDNLETEKSLSENHEGGCMSFILVDAYLYHGQEAQLMCDCLLTGFLILST